MAKRCWPVHEAIMKVVSPRLIIAFGNSDVSPYAYLHNMLGGEQDYFPSGHGNWAVKGFSASINDSPAYVIGLPHLSRYNIIGKGAVIEWILGKQKAVQVTCI